MRTFSIMLTFAAVGIATAQQNKPVTKPPAATAPQPAPAERGRDPYVKYGCYECHGYEAQGGGAGPRIGPNPLPLEGFTKYVRRPTRDMPPYSEKILPDEVVKEIYAFVESRRPKAAQRPALLK